MTLLNINKGTVHLFWYSSDLCLYHEIQEPKTYIYMKIVNGVSSLFNTRGLYVGCESVPEFTSALNSLNL